VPGGKKSDARRRAGASSGGVEIQERPTAGKASSTIGDKLGKGNNLQARPGELVESLEPINTLIGVAPLLLIRAAKEAEDVEKAAQDNPKQC
jgi:hypothetical protein